MSNCVRVFVYYILLHMHVLTCNWLYTTSLRGYHKYSFMLLCTYAHTIQWCSEANLQCVFDYVVLALLRESE